MPAEPPRKMLPPPITRAISTPRLWTSHSSSAICDSVAWSSPNLLDPISASPDSLSKMRRNFTPGASGNLVSTLSPMDAARSPGVVPFACFCAAPALNTPLPLPLPLPLATIASSPVAGLGLACLLLHLGGEVVGALLETLADLVTEEAAHAHVLARLGDQIREQRPDVLLALGILHPHLIQQADLLRPLRDLAVDDLRDHGVGLAGLLGLLEADRLLLLEDGRRDLFLRDVRWVERRHLHRDLLRERHEVGVARDEVRLAVHLHEHTDPRAMQVVRDHPFGRDARRLLGGGGDPLLAEVLDRLLHVAGGLRQRLLAVSHPCAGTLAQVLDHLCRDFSHSLSCPREVSRRWAAFAAFAAFGSWLVLARFVVRGGGRLGGRQIAAPARHDLDARPFAPR